MTSRGQSAAIDARVSVTMSATRDLIDMRYWREVK
jgi:hypothetical protein